MTIAHFELQVNAAQVARCQREDEGFVEQRIGSRSQCPSGELERRLVRYQRHFDARIRSFLIPVMASSSTTQFIHIFVNSNAPRHKSCQ